ncbi:unnamed protein product [Leuciscus chuanchicus]
MLSGREVKQRSVGKQINESGGQGFIPTAEADCAQRKRQPDDFKMAVSVVTFTIREETDHLMITCSCQSLIRMKNTHLQTHGYTLFTCSTSHGTSARKSPEITFGKRLLCLPVWKYTGLILCSRFLSAPELFLQPRNRKDPVITVVA